MSLDERDRSDLLGLVSGFGTADSHERAEHLARTNTEAAEYLRQVRQIATAFEPPPVAAQEETLPPDEADKLANLVLVRMAKRSSLGGRQVSRMPFWMRPAAGAAAAIVLIVLSGVWVAWKTSGSASRKASFGTLVFETRGAAGTAPYEQGPLVPGQIVTAPQNERATITMSDGTRLTLEHLGSVQVGRDGHSFVLREGTMRIAAAGVTTVETEGITITLRPGASAIMRRPTGAACFIYTGSATVSTPSGSYEVAAGQRAYWDREKRTLRIRPQITPTPSWVEEPGER